MRFAMLVIVLGFPLIDLYATVRIARWTGVPVYVWLGLAALAGLYLLRNERTAFRANTVAAMHGEQPLLRGLFDSGRKVLAGMLLLLPGILSDVMALALLALRSISGANTRRAPRGRRFRGRQVDRRRVPAPRLTSGLDRGAAAATSSGRAPSARPCRRGDTHGATSRRRSRSSAAKATGPS